MTARPGELFADVETVGELIGQAIGLGSTCWSNLNGAGVFDSTLAAAIVTEVTTRLGRMGVPESAPLDALRRLGQPPPDSHECTVPVATPHGGRASCGRGCGQGFAVIGDEWVAV